MICNLRHARAVMHASIDDYRFPLESVAGKTFPTFPAHAQPAILRIWQEAHRDIFAKSYGFLDILQHNVLMALYQKRLEIDKQIFTFVGRSVSLSYSAYVQNLCVIL